MTAKLARPIDLAEITPEEQQTALYVVANLIEPRPGDLLLPRYARSVRSDLDLLVIRAVSPPVKNSDGSESHGWVRVHPKGSPETETEMSYIAARAYRLEYLFCKQNGELANVAPPAKPKDKVAPQPAVFRSVNGKKIPLTDPGAFQGSTPPPTTKENADRVKPAPKPKKEPSIDQVTLDLREIPASDDKALIAYAVGKGVPKKYITELVTTAPNGGVKKMRVGNAVRNHAKGTK